MELIESLYQFGQLIFEPLITGPSPMDIVYLLDDYVRWFFNEPPREP
jgi:hypothetical protein